MSKKFVAIHGRSFPTPILRYFYPCTLPVRSAFLVCYAESHFIGWIVLFPTALFFGEMRLASKSVWTAFLLHQVVNAVSMPLVLKGFITSNNWTSLILSPANDSIILSLLMGAAGYWIYRQRMKKLQLEK